MNAAPSPSGWRAEVLPTIKLAIPIMAGMLSQMLMGLTDTLFLGHVGMIPLAASSFVHIVTHPPFVFGLGVLSSVAVLTSQAFGAGETNRFRIILRHGLLIATCWGLLIGLGGHAIQPFLDSMGQDPEVIEASRTFLILFGWSILPALVSHAAKQFSEALGQAWIPNVIMLLAVVLNAIFNWIFVLGNLGSPPLGAEGSGFSTLLARTLMAAALLYYVFRSARFTKHPSAGRWFDRIALTQLLRLGGPIGFTQLMEVAAFAFAGLMMGWLSAAAIAAHQVAITCAATAFMFPLGLGIAICIRVGHAYGAREFDRVRQIGLVGLGLAGLIMILFGILFITGAPLLARAFLASTETQALTITIQLFVVAALFQIVDGLQVVGINALRGISDVRIPALIAILAYWIVAIPMSYLLAFHANTGPAGVWIGLAFGLGVAAAFLSWRFHRLTRPASLPFAQAAA